nr:MarR family transcriptional regulator [uncultured Flavonifractor sp.]
MEQQRETLLRQIWAAQDEAYDLMYEYDSLPHQYGENTLYQAEAHIIDLIGEHPEITVTELATVLKKTPSACSQIVRKLRAKGWVEQVRNKKNNRVYNLLLTTKGQQIYLDHTAFNRSCQKATFQLLDTFSTQELEHHLMVQKKLNEAYQEDLRSSRDLHR